MLLHEKKRLAEIRSNLQDLLALTTGINQPRKVGIKAGGERDTISLSSLARKKKTIAFNKQVSKPQLMVEDGKNIYLILIFSFLSEDHAISKWNLTVPLNAYATHI